MEHEEIKRILVILNKHNALADEEDTYLLDYITNLQQEKDKIFQASLEMQKELTNRIYKARKMIFDNYGVLDKYEIEILDDILQNGSNK